MKVVCYQLRYDRICIAFFVAFFIYSLIRCFVIRSVDQKFNEKCEFFLFEFSIVFSIYCLKQIECMILLALRKVVI